MAEKSQPKRYPRFSAAQRFEHFVLIVVFIGLAFTGMTQKFAIEGWAEWCIRVMGGIESVRIIHRVLAVFLMIEVIYHVVSVAFRLIVLRQSATMRPRGRDLGDLRDWVLYNLGAKAQPPAMPRYNFRQKAMYWGTVIGTLILIITGLMLWNPVAITRILPGTAIPAAQTVHSSQALLAILVVVIWHLYTVLIGRFNPSMFSGKLSREAMQEEHAEELAAIESGAESPAMPAEALAQRRQRFLRITAVIVVIVLGALYAYLTFEDTAIHTVPRQHESVIFAPPEVPTTGDVAVGAAVWATSRCAFCHGAQAEGGAVAGAPALRDTILGYQEFYVQVREGDTDMPAFSKEEIPDAYLVHLWAWLNH